MSGAEDLAALRARAAQLDGRLLELIGERIALAGRIGERDPTGQEAAAARAEDERRRAMARERAARFGVSPRVMDAILDALSRAAVEREQRARGRALGGGGGRALVLGGAGGMGGWTAELLRELGHTVALVDPRLGGDAPGEHASLADVPDLDEFGALFVAVPLRATADALRELAARRPRGLVVELSSIKAPLAAALPELERAGLRLVALHPMFGPGKPHFERMTFVLAARDPDGRERARLAPWLAHRHVELIEVPFAHHDRLMGWLLGLAHLSGMAFASALARSGLAPAELFACASTTFARQAATSQSILGEDPELYFDIQALNPFREGVHAAAREALDELTRAVERGDREAFRALLGTAAQAVREPGPGAAAARAAR